jgi:glycosyltransferase involved in cell wall biosynthesis
LVTLSSASALFLNQVNLVNKTKFRVAFVAPGSIGHTIKWVNGFAGRGIDVTLITQHKITSKIHSDVSVVYLPFSGGKGYILNALALKKAIKKLSPNVVNVHYASGYGTLALLAGIKPYILSVWGSDVYEFPYQSKLKHWLIKKSLLNAKYIASTSYAMAEQVKNILNTEKLDIAITPFGVNLANFSKTKTPFASDIITIGIVKRLEHKYGVDLLIEGFAIAETQLKLHKEHENIQLKLIIVGDGSLECELKKIARTRGVLDKTNFAGAVENHQVARYINEMDIFVVPSRIESFGVAAIEALGCERPCIVANTGGLPEVILNGKTGLVVDAESAEAIASAIVYCINNKTAAINMGIKGRESVMQNYTESAALDTMVNLYHQFDKKNVD